MEPPLWELRRAKRNIFREFIEEDESHTKNKHVKKADTDNFDMLGEGSHRTAIQTYMHEWKS